MRKLVTILVALLFVFASVGNVYAFKSLYSNKGGYDNKLDYSQFQNVPYMAFFNGHSPKPAKINVQGSDALGRKIQAVVPVNQEEEVVEQKGLEK